MVSPPTGEDEIDMKTFHKRLRYFYIGIEIDIFIYQNYMGKITH